MVPEGYCRVWAMNRALVLPPLLVALSVLTGCIKTGKQELDPEFAKAKAETSGLPVALPPVAETFEYKTSTAAFRSDPAFLGKYLSDMVAFGPVPLLPIDMQYYEVRTAKGTRADLVRDAAAERLKARGIPARYGQPGPDELALAVTLRSLELNAKHGFITLIIDSGLTFQGLHPTVSLACKLLRGEQAVWSGETTTALAAEHYKFAGHAISAAIAAAVDDCVEKSKVVSVRAGVVAGRFAELLKNGQYAEAYRIAATPEQAASAVDGLARSFAGRAVPEEAKELMARGRAAATMAKSAVDFGTASDAMERAVDLAPWWASGHYNAALAAEGAGRWTAGAKHLKHYLKLKPDADDREAVRTKIAELELRQERGERPVGDAKP